MHRFHIKKILLTILLSLPTSVSAEITKAQELAICTEAAFFLKTTDLEDYNSKLRVEVLAQFPKDRFEFMYGWHMGWATAFTSGIAARTADDVDAVRLHNLKECRVDL